LQNGYVCHQKIDPLGFAPENFASVGGFHERYRSNGKGDDPPEKGKMTWRFTYKLGPFPSGAKPEDSVIVKSRG
jgi:hypothetical protein